MLYNDIKSLVPTITNAREVMEATLSGSVEIRALAEFQLSTGDLKIQWEVSHCGNYTNNYKTETVTGQHLPSVISELMRRRNIAQQMAPLCLPRVTAEDMVEAPAVTDDSVPF